MGIVPEKRVRIYINGRALTGGGRFGSTSSLA